MTNKEKLCKTCIYGDKIEYDKPCVVYSDKCELYEQKKPMTNEEAINTLKSLKDYYNDKNEDSYVGFDSEDNEALDMAIKALEIELLTDTEQRIFLKAMSREREVCQKVDDEYVTDSNTSLVEVCDSIERKVKKIWDIPEPYKAESEE